MIKITRSSFRKRVSPSFSRMFYPCEPVRSSSQVLIRMWSDHQYTWICIWAEEEWKITGDILWPTSGHASGIKVEEVGGLGGSFYSHCRSSSHVFKKEPVEPLVRCPHVEYSIIFLYSIYLSNMLSLHLQKLAFDPTEPLSFFLSIFCITNVFACMMSLFISSLSSPPYTSLVLFKVSSSGSVVKSWWDKMADLATFCFTRMLWKGITAWFFLARKACSNCLRGSPLSTCAFDSIFQSFCCFLQQFFF